MGNKIGGRRKSKLTPNQETSSRKASTDALSESADPTGNVTLSTMNSINPDSQLPATLTGIIGTIAEEVRTSMSEETQTPTTVSDTVPKELSERIMEEVTAAGIKMASEVINNEFGKLHDTLDRAESKPLTPTSDVPTPSIADAPTPQPSIESRPVIQKQPSVEALLLSGTSQTVEVSTVTPVERMIVEEETAAVPEPVVPVATPTVDTPVVDASIQEQVVAEAKKEEQGFLEAVLNEIPSPTNDLNTTDNPIPASQELVSEVSKVEEQKSEVEEKVTNEMELKTSSDDTKESTDADAVVQSINSAPVEVVSEVVSVNVSDAPTVPAVETVPEPPTMAPVTESVDNNNTPGQVIEGLKSVVTETDAIVDTIAANNNQNLESTVSNGIASE